jgi:uncharacterized membrane protein YhiD involved in acid resistance
MSEHPFELEARRMFAQPPDLGGEGRFENDILRRVTDYQQVRTRVFHLLTAVGVLSAGLILSLSGLLGGLSRAAAAWAQNTAATGESVGVAMTAVGPGAWIVLTLIVLIGAAAYSLNNRLI